MPVSFWYFKLNREKDYTMNTKLLLLPVLLIATHTNAASLTSTFSTNDVTVSDGFISVSGSSFTTGLSYRSIFENNIGMLAGFSYMTGDIEGYPISGTMFSVGGGYALSNDLDKTNGKGSEIVVGAVMNNMNIDFGNTSSTESTIDLTISGEMAFTPTMTSTFTLSTPTDNIGNSLNYAAGVTFGNYSVGISGSNSNVDGITSDGSGFYLGYTSRF